VVAFVLLALAYDSMDPAKEATARLDACLAASGAPLTVSASARRAAPQPRDHDTQDQTFAAALLACSTQP
jgi:hypothetical protein